MLKPEPISKPLLLLLHIYILCSAYNASNAFKNALDVAETKTTSSKCQKIAILTSGSRHHKLHSMLSSQPQLRRDGPYVYN